MSIWNHYILASSVEEALNALASASGDAYPVGGGTDLLLEIQQGHHAPVDTLVDITHIQELKIIEERQAALFIGAAVSVREVAESALVCTHAQAVSEACGLIGGPQVRNTATLGGNVAHALPAADGMIGLLAMDAQVEIASANGRRIVPMMSLFRGPGKSTLLPKSEILTGFYLPFLKNDQGSAFSRIMRPQGVALPVLNMAAWLLRDKKKIRDIRLAVGPAGPTPQRAFAIEEFLKNEDYSIDKLASAKAIWESSMRYRTSAMRSTAQYRYHLSGVLLEEVVEKAWQRAEFAEAK